MDSDKRKRLKWVQMYLASGDAGQACRRCGISRPTLRKWVKRFKKAGEDGLRSLSRRPHSSPGRKLNERDREQILQLRRAGNGARRIQSELRLHEERQLSLATIHKVLIAAKAAPLTKPRRPPPLKRYSRPIPGDRVQMDTMKVAAGVYQYTAIDDCSRFRVLGVYPRRSASSTVAFLDRVIEEMPFPIQRLQTDRGREFFAESVQRKLQANFIKFRPIPPRSPRLNGKVERSQLTDLIEFCSRHAPTDADIAQRIEEWQFDYNWRRSHGALAGKTPACRMAELGDRTPLNEDVAMAYDESKERLRYADWTVDRAMAAIAAARENRGRQQ